MPPSRDAPRAPLPPRVGPPSVLIVDDSVLLLGVLERVLRPLNCLVMTASSAAQARAYCMSGLPLDLAIVDWRLGSEDGVALIAELRVLLGEAAPLFVLHTGDDWRDGPLPTGVSAVMLKPMSADDLLAFVEAQLVACRERAEVRCEVPPAATEAS